VLHARLVLLVRLPQALANLHVPCVLWANTAMELLIVERALKRAHLLKILMGGVNALVLLTRHALNCVLPIAHMEM